MHLSTLVTLFAACASAKPFSLPNGFPKLGPAALAAVEKEAGGTLPNTPLPKKLSKEAIATFQLIAAQETFEVAYFSDLLRNVTSAAPGYAPSDAAAITSALTAIRAQEELHATGANAILQSAGEKPVPACEYAFPVSNFDDAIALAATFTDVVLGVLPVAQKLYGMDGGTESGLVPLIGSIIGQEAQQDGWYRILGKKNPSASPFLTGSTPEFAYSALKMFIVKGSCPTAENLPISSFPPIVVTNPPTTPENTMLHMEVEGPVDAKTMSVTYLSGQNKPVVVPIQNVQTSKGVSTFDAELPFSKGFAQGLTIAAVTKGKSSFVSSVQVPKAAVYGPGLIEIG